MFSVHRIFHIFTFPIECWGQKSFPLVMPHLTLVTFIVTGTIASLKPVPDFPHLMDFLVSVFYSVSQYPFLNKMFTLFKSTKIKLTCSCLSIIIHYLSTSKNSIFIMWYLCMQIKFQKYNDSFSNCLLKMFMYYFWMCEYISWHGIKELSRCNWIKKHEMKWLSQTTQGS